MDFDFKFGTRQRLYTTDHFWFEVDTYERVDGAQVLIAHVRIVHWAPSVLKECRRIWHSFLKCVPGPIFTLGIVDDDKFAKFVRSFGYEDFQTVTCVNGEVRRLFIHKGLLPRKAASYLEGHAQ